MKDMISELSWIIVLSILNLMMIEVLQWILTMVSL